MRSPRSRAAQPGVCVPLAALIATFTLGAGLAHGQSAEPADVEQAAEPTATAAADSGGIGSSGGSGDGSGTTGEQSTGDTSGSSESTGDGGKVELLLANARPGKAFVLGDPMVFHYAISNSSSNDLDIEIVSKKTSEVVRTIDQRDVTPKQEHTVSWDGKGDDARWAKEGEYRVRVTSTDGTKADVSRADGKRRAGLYKHKFPVRGKHDYGDGIGAGRGHQGQDVFAKCGTKLVAAHAGKVQAKAYHDAAGYYVVIDGKKTDHDYVYMHLADKATVGEGERVKTGEKIGRVGETGNASGCHLHFELWSKPGWYEGGDFLHSVTRKLKKWDRYS